MRLISWEDFRIRWIEDSSRSCSVVYGDLTVSFGLLGTLWSSLLLCVLPPCLVSGTADATSTTDWLGTLMTSSVLTSAGWSWSSARVSRFSCAIILGFYSLVPNWRFSYWSGLIINGHELRLASGRSQEGLESMWVVKVALKSKWCCNSLNKLFRMVRGWGVIRTASCSTFDATGWCSLCVGGCYVNDS